ncbi:MAG: glycosyltransferase [Bacteroidales bacterium]|nr:glycosyltransferase [Candidatus Equimonas faecalis]
MNKPKISIVVAMYNIQDYIIPCLESCAKQQHVTPDDYEVIIVNDGATDSSPKLVQDFIVNKPNFRMITRENGGLSAARNTGIENAVGEYIWFVDGDDAIAPNAISVLLHNIAETHCDAYLHNFSTFENNGELLSTSDFKGYDTILSGKDIHNKYERILPMMAWLTVYKSSLLKEYNLKFKEGILHEDKEFSIRSHHLVKSLIIIGSSLYYYRTARTGSIMSNVRKDNTKSLVSEIEIIKSFKHFFKNEDTPFVRKSIGICATSFLIRRYDPAFVLNDTTKALISSNKKELYELMWKSRQWKRRALLVFIITMPASIISKVLYKIGERSKLM